MQNPLMNNLTSYQHSEIIFVCYLYDIEFHYHYEIVIRICQVRIIKNLLMYENYLLFRITHSFSP